MVLDRIHIDPQVCGGKATIRGLRLTVDFVLRLLGDGYTAAEIVKEYSELVLEDVYQAAKMAPGWRVSTRQLLHEAAGRSPHRTSYRSIPSLIRSRCARDRPSPRNGLR